MSTRNHKRVQVSLHGFWERQQQRVAERLKRQQLAREALPVGRILRRTTHTRIRSCLPCVTFTRSSARRRATRDSARSGTHDRNGSLRAERQASSSEGSRMYRGRQRSRFKNAERRNMKSMNAVLALALILGVAALTLLSMPASHSKVTYQSVIDPMKG